MSAAQKEHFDTFFKGFMMIAVAVIGFFAARSMNTLDKATDDIQALKVNSAVMQNDITNFKESWKSFVNLVNAKEIEAERDASIKKIK